MGIASVQGTWPRLPDLIDAHPAVTFPIDLHYCRAARLSSTFLSVLLHTTDKNVFITGAFPLPPAFRHVPQGAADPGLCHTGTRIHRPIAMFRPIARDMVAPGAWL